MTISKEEATQLVARTRMSANFGGWREPSYTLLLHDLCDAVESQAQEIEALLADAERYKLALEKIAGISRYEYSTDWSAVIAAMMMADEVLAVKAKP